MSDNKNTEKVNVGVFLPRSSERRNGVMCPKCREDSPINLIPFYFEKGESGDLHFFRDEEGKVTVSKEEIESGVEAGASFHEEFTLQAYSFPTLAGMGGEIVSGNVFRCGYSWRTLSIIFASIIADDIAKKTNGQEINGNGDVLCITYHKELGAHFYSTFEKVLNNHNIKVSNQFDERTAINYEYIVVYGYGGEYNEKLTWFLDNHEQMLNPRVKVYFDINYLIYHYENAGKIDKESDWCRDHIVVLAAKDCRPDEFQRFLNMSIELLEAAVSSGNKNKEQIAEWIRNCHFYESECGSLFFRNDGEIFFPLFVYNGNLDSPHIVDKDLKYYNNKKVMTKERAAESIKEMMRICLPLLSGKTDIPAGFNAKDDPEFSKFLLQCENLLSQATYDPLRLDMIVNYGSIRDVVYTIRLGINTQLLSSKEMAALFRLADGETLQLNVDDFDVEDNNTRRVYFLHGEDKGRTLGAFNNWHDIQHDENVDISVAKSEERANGNKFKLSLNGCGGLSKVYSFSKENGVKFVYFVPIAQESVRCCNGIVVWSKCKFSLFDLQIITNLVSILFSAIESRLLNKECLKAQIQSAIGSIMSRNGSHNIGSHVLAALSHNVGTMPDDQVLYQYIQHRMDYIATATTDRPTWTQPTMFVGDMMRRFLSQRHLLNYISRSEGLKAWEFQSDRAVRESAGEHIKFHIRKVDKAGKVVPGGNYVDYDNPNKRIDLAGDVSLAIPGGIVGQHAFFTIIENIVRNAAKHDWVTPPTATQTLKFNGGDAKNPRGNLDIYIDFEDDPNDENVHFTIWTRLSDVMDGKTDKHKAKGLNQSLYESCTDAEWDQWLSAKDIKDLPLHWHQEVELARPFIDGNGGLRRENWGLAEMKISAGYLQKAKIEDIGGISNGGHDIIIPSCVTDERANDNAQTLEGVYHLGYKFDVPKAKLILLVVDEWPEEWTDELEVGLKCNGIYVRLADDLDKGKELSYQYVVMDSYTGDKLNYMLPFRIIVTKERDPSVEDKVPCLFKSNEKKTVREFLNTIIKYCDKKENICDSIVESVCACWARHIIAERRKQKKIAEVEFIEHIDENGEIKEKQRIETKEDLIGDKPLSLVVSTEGGDSGAGETLVTDLDIVEYAFNEGIDGALDGFLSTSKDSAAKKFVDKLKGLKKWRNSNGKIENKLFFDRERVLDLIKNNVGQQDYSTEAIVKRQLRIWLELCDDTGEVRTAVNYLDGKSENIQKIKADIDACARDRDIYALGTEEWKKKAYEIVKLNMELEDAQQSLANPIAEVVVYLKSYCLQIKRLISKYSEKIATLPRGFSVGRKPDNGRSSKKKSLSFDNGWEVAGIKPFQETMLYQGEIENMPVIKSHVLRYWRHQTKKMKSERYLEGLSGTQSYLSTLENIEETKKVTKFALITRLVENALLRILIIDERTREFLEKHEALKNVYSNMGIYVADDKKVSEELDAIEKGDDIKDTSFLMTNGFVNLSPNVIDRVRKGYPGCQDKKKAKETARNEAREKFHEQFDIIIIHQGIIDKWLPGASHDKGKVELFIESLRCVFRYVVITTGRGTPANIPKSARVLPFSTIQTTLFRQYPEKMILTDAIMNMLPVKGAQNE